MIHASHTCAHRPSLNQNVVQTQNLFDVLHIFRHKTQPQIVHADSSIPTVQIGNASHGAWHCNNLFKSTQQTWKQQLWPNRCSYTWRRNLCAAVWTCQRLVRHAKQPFAEFIYVCIYCGIDVGGKNKKHNNEHVYNLLTNSYIHIFIFGEDPGDAEHYLYIHQAHRLF